MRKYNKADYPSKVCEYCGYSIGLNSFSRNHGDNCPYKGAKPGHKFCKLCGKELPLTEFSKVASPTYDGLNQACKECASIRRITCPYCDNRIITKYSRHRFVVEKVKED